MDRFPYRIAGFALGLLLVVQVDPAQAQRHAAPTPQAAEARMPMSRPAGRPPTGPSRTTMADSIYYDDGNAAPDDFIGIGTPTAFYAATRFTASSGFTLTGARIAYRTESGTSDFVLAVFDDAAGPNDPTGGNLLFFGTSDALSQNGRFGAFPFSPAPEPFVTGESFFIVVGFFDVPFPAGGDTQGTGDYTGRSFFSGSGDPGDWTPLGDALGGGQQDVWVIRALGESGGGGGEMPDIVVTPPSLSATLAGGASTSLSLPISNTGAGPLTWSAATATARQAAPEPVVGARYGQRPAATDAAALRALVQQNGSAAVIVGLGVPFQPEAVLGRAGAVTAQRQTIVEAREALLDRLAGHGVRGVKRFETVPYVAMTVDATGLDALLADPAVYEVHEDAWLRPSLAESTQIVGAPAAWSQGFTGAGQVVAVLDSGFETAHPFFGGRAVAEACFSTNQPGVAESLCPNGQEQQTGSGATTPCVGIDGCEHGTHVAGIAMGDGPSFSGVAREASLIAVQVFTAVVDPGICGGQQDTPCVLTTVSDQILGLEYVYGQRDAFAVASVNMSLGGGQFPGACDSEPHKPIIDNLRAAGIATVIAAGNESFTGAIGSPACISSAVAVGSTQDGSGSTVFDNVSPFSNSSNALDLLAPGQFIESSVPGGGSGILAGTSMAAPHVAGAWAVLKQQDPQASVSDVLNAIASTGVPITDARNGITRPRLQLDAALGSGGGGAGWLAVGPASGTTAPGGSSALAVTLDAAGLSPGTYSGMVTITSNDPDEAVVTVPVTLTVGGGGAGAVLTHLTGADAQNTFTTNDSGFVHGTNEFGDLAKAVAFEIPTGVPNALSGVDLYLSARHPTPVLEAYTLRIYGGTPNAGPQGAPLFEQTYTLADAQVDADSDTPSPPTELRFGPVTVPDAFFVSIEYEAPYGNGDFNIASTDLLGEASPYEWEQWGDGSWHNMSEAWFQDGGDGWHMWVEAVMETPVANEESRGQPERLALAPGYPNPFVSATTLRYSLPRAADVRLEVFDVLGRRVATPAAGYQAAGKHEVRWEARGLASGVYIARLVTAGAVVTQRLTLLR
jgi:subtilisin family serine protease